MTILGLALFLVVLVGSFTAFALILYRILLGHRIIMTDAEERNLRFSMLLKARPSGEDLDVETARAMEIDFNDTESVVRRCLAVLDDDECEAESRTFCASLIAQHGRSDLIDAGVVARVLRTRSTPKPVIASVMNMAIRLGTRIEPAAIKAALASQGRRDPLCESVLRKGLRAASESS